MATIVEQAKAQSGQVRGIHQGELLRHSYRPRESGAAQRYHR